MTDLIGGKVLVCQIRMKLAPGINPVQAKEAFEQRLQIPGAFAKGADVLFAIVDAADAPNGRLAF